MLKIGRASYINTLPLFLGLTSSGLDSPFEFVTAPPSELNQKLRSGEVDAALISSIEYLRNPGEYELLSPYGIAARRGVSSVTLYLRGNVEELDGERVALTQASETSAELVRLLCRYYWQVDPQFEPLTEERSSYAAFLLIGDEALKQPQIDGYHPIDLAAAWHQYTETPMVFALLACRAEMAKEKIDLLKNQFRRSFEWSRRERDHLIQTAHERSGLAPSICSHYFDQLNYQIGEREVAGLERYAALATLNGQKP